MVTLGQTEQIEKRHRYFWEEGVCGLALCADLPTPHTV
jgi:hypothetical protein